MHESVKEYYGKVLQGSADLQTDACCTGTALPSYVKRALSRIHEEVMSRYYGCGLVMPQQLAACRVLDLGCGSGRDCFALAQLVGPDGYVLGVDMTDEQLAVARRHVEYHRRKFGYATANTEFRKGYIERLDELDLPDGSFDVIVSNCVINLSTDKEAVLAEAYRLLKPGGEMYFSDVYADRRVPASLVDDPLLYGECLSGALYWNDFLELARRAGFRDPRLVDDRPLAVNNPQILERVGHIGFHSATCRLFKLDGLEPHCEDYGQAVVYRGTIEHHPEQFVLDKHHRIARGKAFPVCGNTWRMLSDSRFRPHFTFIGDFDSHYGIFDGCRTAMPFAGPRQIVEVDESTSGDCC